MGKKEVQLLVGLLGGGDDVNATNQREYLGNVLGGIRWNINININTKNKYKRL